MSGALREQFIPRPTYKGEAYARDSQKYEGVKAKIDSQFLLVEGCLQKCGANFKEGGLGPNGDVCMTKCYSKFFDSALVCNKEIQLYTVAANNVL